ncbi:MAG: putative fluoride ion transporter CrcB [Planctomycetes bacterium]|nr:putative fluoride ion transporter CrcB [Planctomycetota bacterium]HRJ77155.1 CrcB family protein [Planctomycetota bacterium]
MKLFLLVCLGGALGSGARYGVDLAFRAMAPQLAAVFPWATLFVNLAGCFAIGLGYGWLARGDQPLGEELRALLLVGVCGGLTTFSAFANQTLALDSGKGMLNVAASVLGSLAMAWAGLALSEGR